MASPDDIQAFWSATPEERAHFLSQIPEDHRTEYMTPPSVAAPAPAAAQMPEPTAPIFRTNQKQEFMSGPEVAGPGPSLLSQAGRGISNLVSGTVQGVRDLTAPIREPLMALRDSAMEEMYGRGNYTPTQAEDIGQALIRPGEAAAGMLGAPLTAMGLPEGRSVTDWTDPAAGIHDRDFRILARAGAGNAGETPTISGALGRAATLGMAALPLAHGFKGAGLTAAEAALESAREIPEASMTIGRGPLRPEGMPDFVPGPPGQLPPATAPLMLPPASIEMGAGPVKGLGQPYTYRRAAGEPRTVVEPTGPEQLEIYPAGPTQVESITHGQYEYGEGGRLQKPTIESRESTPVEYAPYTPIGYRSYTPLETTTIQPERPFAREAVGPAPELLGSEALPELKSAADPAIRFLDDPGPPVDGPPALGVNQIPISRALGGDEALSIPRASAANQVKISEALPTEETPSPNVPPGRETPAQLEALDRQLREKFQIRDRTQVEEPPPVTPGVLESNLPPPEETLVEGPARGELRGPEPRPPRLTPPNPDVPRPPRGRPRSSPRSNSKRR